MNYTITFATFLTAPVASPLARQDKSGSGHDMELVCIAVSSEWWNVGIGASVGRNQYCFPDYNGQMGKMRKPLHSYSFYVDIHALNVRQNLKGTPCLPGGA